MSKSNGHTAGLTNREEELIAEAKEIDVAIATDGEGRRYTEPHRLLTLDEERLLVRSLVARRAEYRKAVHVCTSEYIASLLDKISGVATIRDFFYTENAELDPDTLVETLPALAAKLQKTNASIRTLLTNPKKSSKALRAARDKLHATLEPYAVRLPMLHELSQILQDEIEFSAHSNGHAENVFPGLHTNEELPHALAAIDRARNAYLRIAHALMSFNVRFIAHDVKIEYARNGHRLSFADMRQEAIMGFLRAMETVDDRARVTTYSKSWIRRAMNEAVAEQGPDAVKITIARMRQFYAVHKESKKSGAKGRTLSAQEEKLLNTVRPPISLSGEYDDGGLGGLLAANIPAPEDTSLEEERRHSLDTVLARLKPREEVVIRMRMGMPWREGLPVKFEYRPEGYTLDEVRTHFNVTKERIRQVQVTAMRKLREPSIRKYLEAFMIGCGKSTLQPNDFADSSQ